MFPWPPAGAAANPDTLHLSAREAVPQAPQVSPPLTRADSLEYALISRQTAGDSLVLGSANCRRSRFFLLALGALALLAVAAFAVSVVPHHGDNPVIDFLTTRKTIAKTFATVKAKEVNSASSGSGNSFSAAATAEAPEHPGARKLWRVVVDHVMVREHQSVKSHALDTKTKCSFVRAHQFQDWLALADQPGYMKVELGFVKLMEKVQFVRVLDDSCEATGLHSITEVGTCAAAAGQLGLENFSNYTLRNGTCRASGPTAGSALLAAADAIVGAPAAKVTEQLCLASVCSRKPPSTTAAKGPLTTTTVATTRTWLWPSTFCFMLAQVDGYEVELLKFQWQRKIGIFACDAHRVVTDKPFKLGEEEKTIPIGSFKCDKGAWGSWANAKVFFDGWRAIFRDGTYHHHDFIVKVDADAVFHPGRLKKHLEWLPHGQAAYIKNWKKGYPILGAIEVVTMNAALQFALRGPQECQDMLWGGAEDGFLYHCMERLDVQQWEDKDLLRQHPKGPCSNSWAVVFHPFKDVHTWEQCLQER